ncbi:MAG: BtrH N-terminal domain-containing protein [Spirochaetales bacterium]|nr:BtrH N-terminal domain-containing protein [Spirochaetales bacterium]MCF7938275.1 BtrH N-terminal domain-containing protein [Spirochaetales bacterium]
MASILEGFNPLTGAHCSSTALRQVLHFQRTPLTEEMVFGLAEGLSFFYQEAGDYPRFVGRVRPGYFEERFSANSGVIISGYRPPDTETARKELIEQLSSGRPAVVYADMAYLPYLQLPEHEHFGAHTVVVFGVDPERELAYIADRDGPGHPVAWSGRERPAAFHPVSFEDLDRARGSTHRPHPPAFFWMDVNTTGFLGLTSEVLRTSIHAVCRRMLAPEDHRVGLPAMRSFAGSLKRWPEMPPQQRKRAARAAVISIDAAGGTGGGFFRRLFTGFLRESAVILRKSRLNEIAEQFEETTDLWEHVNRLFGQDLAEGFDEEVSLYSDIAGAVEEIADQEEQIFTSLERLCPSPADMGK